VKIGSCRNILSNANALVLVNLDDNIQTEIFKPRVMIKKK
jgi:hypothetical protein